MSRESELEDQVAALKGLLQIPVLFRSDWRLSRSQSRLLAVLAERGVMSFEQAAAAIDSDLPKGNAANSIRTLISYMRGKLRGTGIVITSRRGVGYCMDDASRERARAGMISFGRDVAN